MNVNNKLYRAYFNQNLPQQKPQSEEKKAEGQATPLIKSPDAEPVTASYDEIIAGMNKGMMVRESGVNEIIELSKMVNKYESEKNSFFANESNYSTEQKSEKATILRNLVMEILNILKPNNTQYLYYSSGALQMYNNWEDEEAFWDNYISNLNGGRGVNNGTETKGADEGMQPDGAKAGGVEPIDAAGSEINSLTELEVENSRIWQYVIDLLNAYDINYGGNDYFWHGLDDQNTPDENYAISKPLAILRNKLIEDGKMDIIDSLRIIVRKYVDRLSYLYNSGCSGLDRGNIEKLCLKDPMEFGIIVQLLEGQY